MLTNNGKAFTGRFALGGECKPTGKYEVDKLCKSNGIEHLLVEPKHPEMNAMLKRYNVGIANVLRSRLYDSSEDLEVIKALLLYKSAYQSKGSEK